MPRLLVFNPEHDYALACGNVNYTAPTSTKNLASSLELLPLIWSKKDDAILLSDNSVYYISGKVRLDSVEPWGWDQALVARLRKIGIDSNLLPEENSLTTLRRLSHRRISVQCNEFLGSSPLPKEFITVEEALEFERRHSGCYFKLPWSSGGRGIVNTKELSHIQIEEWVRGAIKKQGSVMGEIGIDRVLDFASLWKVNSGKVEFEGLSVSASDGRGKYKGNIYGSQIKIEAFIKRKVPSFSQDLLFRQAKFIEIAIAKNYTGKLGIDMIGDRDGKVHPCSEINLRRTMGHVAMDYARLEPDSDIKNKLDSLPLIPIESL